MLLKKQPSLRAKISPTISNQKETNHVATQRNATCGTIVEHAGTTLHKHVGKGGQLLP